MNQNNQYGERHGYWESHWDNPNFNLKKPRYMWRGQYDNGTPIGLFLYYFYNRKLNRKEFYL